MAQPLTQPSAEDVARSQMTAFARSFGRALGRDLTDADALHRSSVEHADVFWGHLLQFLELDVEGSREPVLSGTSCESARFFPRLALSFARNLLRGEVSDQERPAVVAVDETGRRRTLTRAALARDVVAVASALATRGVGAGDRVVAVAANTLESVVACLAAAAVGASWSSVAPNLGLDATLDRFGQLSPKVLFACSRYPYQGRVYDVSERTAALAAQLPSLELVVSLDDAPATSSVDAPRSTRLPTVSLTALAAETGGPFAALADLPTFPFDHPLYVLFSSGTTGRPKCIVHGAGGTLLEHAKEHRLHSDLRPGDVLFFQTAAGWMMWNWLVSALASKVTVLLYEGSPTFPTADALWRLVAAERVTVFGTNPGFLQLSRDAEVEPRRLDLGALRAVQSTGSVLGDDLFRWITSAVKSVPVQSISGGTDIVGCFLLGHPNLPVYAGELQSKSLGYDVDAFLPDGSSAGVGAIGELVCKRPFPSRPVGLFGDDDGSRFHAAYFADHDGVWTHGDLLEPTASGGGRIHGRSDGILNVRGVRIGPAEIYRALSAGVPEVAEAMAVEQQAPHEIGGSRLVLLLVLKEGQSLGAELERRIRAELFARCSAAHVPEVIVSRLDLPTTYSGKRSERAARDAVNGRPIVNLGALKNPESLEGLADATKLPEHDASASPEELSLERLTGLWAEVLGFATIAKDQSFFDLGGTSLGAVSLLARVEKVFGVRLAMSSLLATAATPERMVQALRADDGARGASHIVPIRMPAGRGASVPAFWLPGGGGLSVLAFREVSMRFPEGQPVYGFEAKLSLEDAPKSIPEIARRYVDDLVRSFPDVPYLLFGFSFGSWVAFEMAIELRRRGKEVPLLCVFDSAIPVARSLGARAVIAAERASYHGKQVARLAAHELPMYFSGIVDLASRRAREAASRFGLDLDPRRTTEASGDTVFDELDRRNRAAALRYVKGPLPTFDGKITVILAERTSQSAVRPELDDRLAIGAYAARGLEVHRVPGAHLTMLEPPEVDGLAEVLRGCIARALGS